LHCYRFEERSFLLSDPPLAAALLECESELRRTWRSPEPMLSPSLDLLASKRTITNGVRSSSVTGDTFGWEIPRCSGEVTRRIQRQWRYTSSCVMNSKTKSATTKTLMSSFRVDRICKTRLDYSLICALPTFMSRQR